MLFIKLCFIPFQGDSGGPLILNDTVIGIASFAMEGCADEKFPTVFVNLSKYIDWIKTNSQFNECEKKSLFSTCSFKNLKRFLLSFVRKIKFWENK